MLDWEVGQLWVESPVTPNRSLICLFTVLGTAIPALAGAADGVIELNQACVQAGCVPGDDPGFPIVIGTPGSYKLTGNLDVSTDVTAISITAHSVTLDLNGFKIEGAYTCGTSPPDCEGSTGIGIEATGVFTTVINGQVRNFGGGGVVLGNNSRVEQLLVDFVGGDGIAVGQGAQINNNIVGATLGDGISSSAAIVGHNVLLSTRGDGIQVGTTGNVLSNWVANAFDEDGRFGLGVAYGLNSFSTAPIGGLSLGNNRCANAVC